MGDSDSESARVDQKGGEEENVEMKVSMSDHKVITGQQMVLTSATEMFVIEVYLGPALRDQD